MKLWLADQDAVPEQVVLIPSFNQFNQVLFVIKNNKTRCLCI